MAGGIDISNRKPRRLRGTPAITFSNRFAAVVLGVGCLAGLLLNQISIIDLFKAKYEINLLEVSDTELQRRRLFNFTKQNSTEEIMQLLAEKEAMRTDF